MTRFASTTLGMVLLVATLAACGERSDADAGPGGHHGRYLGVGTFAAGRIWSQMADYGKAVAAAATIADDEHVIVVVDSRTGEIRECGDFSGRCVSFNPWTKGTGGLPVTLRKHAADLKAREAQDEADRRETALTR